MKYLLILLCSVSALASPSKDCGKEENYPEITKLDLETKLASKTAVVIDVNSKSSYAEKHIPTAIHFGTTKDLAQVLPADKNSLVVAYCGGPSCGAWKKAAKEACKMGYTNVMHFKGGLKGWFSPDKG